MRLMSSLFISIVKKKKKKKKGKEKQLLDLDIWKISIPANEFQ